MFFLVLFNYLLFFLDRFLLKRFLGLILFLEKTKLLDFISLLLDLNINVIRYVEMFLDLVRNDLWLNAFFFLCLWKVTLFSLHIQWYDLYKSVLCLCLDSDTPPVILWIFLNTACCYENYFKIMTYQVSFWRIIWSFICQIVQMDISYPSPLLQFIVQVPKTSSSY